MRNFIAAWDKYSYYFLSRHANCFIADLTGCLKGVISGDGLNFAGGNNKN